MDVTAQLQDIKLRTDAEPLQLLKELALYPLVYTRPLGILFAIIVFGCMADQGFYSATGISEGTICLYNNSDACNFALAIGVLGFLICCVFLVKDVIMVIVDFSGAVLIKKVIMFVDIGTSGIWMFMWFVAFCFTADQHRKSDAFIKRVNISVSTATKNCLNSTIAFSFFSIFLWGVIIGLNALYLFRIYKGTDHSTRGSNYTNFKDSPGNQQLPIHEDLPEDDDDDFPSAPKNTYTPPEY